MLDWKGEQQRVGYANMKKLGPTNVVRRGSVVGRLQESLPDVSMFTYSYQGTKHDLDHFITRLNVVGLLVISDGRIILERYAQGTTNRCRILPTP